MKIKKISYPEGYYEVPNMNFPQAWKEVKEGSRLYDARTQAWVTVLEATSFQVVIHLDGASKSTYVRTGLISKWGLLLPNDIFIPAEDRATQRKPRVHGLV